MAEIKKLTVISGGKDLNRAIYYFHKAIGTKTRLMGVVALKLHWISDGNIHFVQWFLLDAEEHGIYDYISVKTSLVEETNKYTGQFMGSLGGEKVEISRKEAYYLIQTFAIQNRVYKKSLPRPEGYQFILKATTKLNSDEIRELDYKIFESILQPSQLINFFTMRTVAKDLKGMEYLFDNLKDRKIEEYIPLKKAGVLLKNNIRNTISENSYIADAIVEGKENYFRIKWRLVTTKYRGSYRITDAKLLKRQTLPPEEVALEIQNPEYIKLFRVKVKVETLLQQFDDGNQDFLRYKFLQGTMYVEFQKNNDHVLRYQYHIGGDIKAIYFINHFNQLIVCYYHNDDLEAIEEFLKKPSIKNNIENLDDFERKGSVIYEYAEAEEVDFTEYINNTN